MRDEVHTGRQRLWIRLVGPYLALLSLLAFSGAVLADEQAECIKQSSPFDGIKPLRYATAVGASGSHIYIHASFPTGCMPDKAATCSAPTYVIPGDVVAISKSCGVWSYVQYLGKSKVTTGWTATDQLQSLPPAAPAKNLEIEPNGLPDGPKRYPFELTKGQGVPVCEAYLQRMNQTEFTESRPPYCGRPESTLVPGFAALHRRWMPRASYVRLFMYVDSFLENRAQRDFYVHHAKPDGADEFGPPGDIFPLTYMPSVSHYDPRVDIENNGTYDNVALWNEEDRDYLCVSYPHGGAARVLQSGVILNSDGTSIDADKTRAVFGHPDGAFVYLGGAVGKQTLQREPGYRTIGKEVGIFQYRGIYYFDTFFTQLDQGDFEDRHRNDPVLRDTLGVFLHESGHTKQVCEYHVREQGD